jgi:hypothetical protein
MRHSLLLVAVLLALVGCDRETTDWTPVMEETSTVFLRDQVDKSLEMLEALRARLSVCPDADAREDAARLKTALLHLRHYYLPMVEAREEAYNAYRLYHLKRRSEVGHHLDSARQILEAVASHGGGPMVSEMGRLTGQVLQVGEAVRLGSREAVPRFQQLISSLNLKAMKGDLILNSDAVHTQGATGLR